MKLAEMKKELADDAAWAKRWLHPFSKEEKEEVDRIIARADEALGEKRSCPLIEATVGEDTEEFVEDEHLREALELLEIAGDLLNKADKFLDARNLSLPSDYDYYLGTTLIDIQNFLSDFDRKVGLPARTKKMVVMGPVAREVSVSIPCQKHKHSKCDVIACSCKCHANEDQ